MRTIEQAEAVGLTVDRHCYPHIAYAGARFRPDHIEDVLTEREADLTAKLDVARKEIERLEDARRGDTLTTSHYVANVALKGLWDMLGVTNQTAAILKLRALLKTED